jgi:hypothetical protein
LLRKLRIRIIEEFDTQADFAKFIGERESVVSRVIRARMELPPARKRKWAEVLKCKPEQIFQSEDS